MRRVIKYSVIKNVSDYLKTQKENLLNEQNKIITDIDKISQSYIGEDSYIIISKYMGVANQLNEYINNIENYIMYFDSLCGNYEQSQSKAMSNLSNTVSSSNTDSILNTTLNLDNILLEGVGDNNG